MEITKADAIKQLEGTGGVNRASHQQALVQKLAGAPVQKQVHHEIPGGADLTKNVSREELPLVVFNWLRRVHHFKDVLISLSSDHLKLNTRDVRVVEFNNKQAQPEWEIQGKRWLAERIADILRQENVVALKVDKSGITAYYDNDKVFNSTHDSWLPNLIFTPFKPGF